MPFIESQIFPGTIQEVDTAFKAARVALRPLDHTDGKTGGRVLGHYSIFAQTAAAAFAGNGILASFRFADPTYLCVPLRIYTCVTVVTAVTAQRTDPIVATIARGYTVQDTTNGTLLTTTGNNNKVRTNMGTMLSTIYVAATTGITGGTKTVDSNAFGAAAFGPAAIAAIGTGMPITELYKLEASSRHPLVLAQNEGFVLSWGTTALGTGTATAGFGIDFAEVAIF